MVEVDKAYESLHISPVLWGGPIVDSGDFNRVYRNLVLQDDYHKWSLTVCDGCFDTLKSSKM